ncbi:hypothetical protein TYRP_023317 [Tyrophagus putrescentiae]|nr:hypothetical protein TYRP_023317 [Tyrophagus putrescentiae]
MHLERLWAARSTVKKLTVLLGIFMFTICCNFINWHDLIAQREVAGEVVHIPVWSLHRDPAYWGEDAGEFKPERFLENSSAALKNAAYLPFGAGSRMCIAQRMATVELRLALLHLVRHFRFEVCPEKTEREVTFVNQFDINSPKAAAPAVEEMRGFYAVLPVAQANQSVQIHAAAPVAAAFGAAAAAAAAAVAHPGASNVLAVPVAYHSAAHHSVNFMAAPVQVQARPSLWEAPRHQDGHNYAWGPTLPEYVNYNNNNKRFLAAATYAAAGNGGNHNNNNNNAEDLTTEMTEEKKRQKEEQAELTNCIAAKRLKTDPELEEALSSGKLSDVLLRFPDSSETIPAHRLMLAKGSPTFEAMFSTDMVEKLKGEVLLQDVRPEVMRLVLRFLYNAKPLEQEELQMHAVELYKAGHMYQIEELKKLAELALLVNAQQAADDEAKQLVATAELYGLKELRQRTLTAVKNRLVTKIKGAPLDKHLLNIEAVVNVRKQFMRRIKNQLMMNLTNK